MTDRWAKADEHFRAAERLLAQAQDEGPGVALLLAQAQVHAILSLREPPDDRTHEQRMDDAATSAQAHRRWLT